MSYLTFKYDLDKDLENFLKGQNAVNAKEPTKLDEEFKTLRMEVTEDNVRKFLKEKAEKENIDFNKKISEIEALWKPIEPIFIQRCEAMFETKLPEEAVGYLSLNQRSTYNWRENYFFIYYDSTTPHKTIMHELLHFYTHRKFEVSNDIKESLTALLNTDFADLLGETNDTGYPQHKEMRQKIIKMRKEGKSVEEIVSSL